MRMIDPLLMEFDREASTTKRVLDRVPGDKLSWKPHDKSMTLGKLAWHVATLPGWVGGTVLSDGFDLASGEMPPPPDTVSQIQEKFVKSVEVAKQAMSQLDDEKALGEWKLTKGSAVLLSMPRIAYVRSILLNHLYHHRGQLTVYLRLLDVPVPAIYGASADENPFG